MIRFFREPIYAVIVRTVFYEEGSIDRSGSSYGLPKALRGSTLSNWFSRSLPRPLGALDDGPFFATKSAFRRKQALIGADFTNGK